MYLTMSATRNFPLFSICLTLLAIVALSTADDDEYRDRDYFEKEQQQAQRRQFQRSGGWDPYARDFTERCMRMAKYSGEKACDVFKECCSEGLVLNKLNGDKCQDVDITNGCTLNLQSDGIQWSQCKAFNCTELVTTTTTTTNIPTPASASNVVVSLGICATFAAFAMLICRY
jgi:hypothetical protein